jgi:hypothetical protein
MKYLIRTTVETYWEDVVEADTEEAAFAKAHDLALAQIADDVDNLILCSESFGELLEDEEGD